MPPWLVRNSNRSSFPSRSASSGSSSHWQPKWPEAKTGCGLQCSSLELAHWSEPCRPPHRRCAWIRAARDRAGCAVPTVVRFATGWLERAACGRRFLPGILLKRTQRCGTAPRLATRRHRALDRAPARRPESLLPRSSPPMISPFTGVVHVDVRARYARDTACACAAGCARGLRLALPRGLCARRDRPGRRAALHHRAAREAGVVGSASPASTHPLPHTLAPAAPLVFERRTVRRDHATAASRCGAAARRSLGWRPCFRSARASPKARRRCNRTPATAASLPLPAAQRAGCARDGLGRAPVGSLYGFAATLSTPRGGRPPAAGAGGGGAAGDYVTPAQAGQGFAGVAAPGPPRCPLAALREPCSLALS